jgi:hypothetical protein
MNGSRKHVMNAGVMPSGGFLAEPKIQPVCVLLSQFANVGDAEHFEIGERSWPDVSQFGGGQGCVAVVHARK